MNLTMLKVTLNNVYCMALDIVARRGSLWLYLDCVSVAGMFNLLFRIIQARRHGGGGMQGAIPPPHMIFDFCFFSFSCRKMCRSNTPPPPPPHPAVAAIASRSEQKRGILPSIINTLAQRLESSII